MDNTDEEEQGDVIHEIELLQLDKGINIEAVGFFMNYNQWVCPNLVAS